MNTRLQSLVAVLASIPGYNMTRTQFAAKRSYDLKNQKGSFLDNVGEMIFLDSENAFVIPASDLKYVRLSQINDLGVSRLTKIVATKDGVLCTATGYIEESWLRTLSKITPFKGGDTTEHFVKGFSPGYEGPITGYHMVRIGKELNSKEFTLISGRKIVGLDLVQFEGKVTLAATTKANYRNPTSTVFLREAPLKALMEQASIDAPWTKARWVGDYNVSGLRGFINKEGVCYSFLDTDVDTNKVNFLVASANDKSAKIMKEDVKGILNTVSGVQVDPSHMAVVVTNKQILSIGKKDTVIADLSNPVYAEFARMIREGNTLRGICGKEGIYASSVGDSMGHLAVSPTFSEIRA